MIQIASFYHFTPLDSEQLPQLEQDLFKTALEFDIRGLVILAHEGINSTLAGKEEDLTKIKEWIDDRFAAKIFFKDSVADRQPFRRLVIKRRTEIVTTTSPDLTVETKVNHHLSPTEWNEVLKGEDDFFLVDTRNWYETKIGKFKNAADPHIEQFTEFGEYIESQNLPKDKKILMYCTGGIRCEKGILEMQKKGFENVFQLEGGILNYLQQYPNDEFDGECFVFDGRVAVDQNLQPTTQYDLCPYTGQPADVEIECERCSSKAKISEEIYALKDIRSRTCSKNCAYHWQLNPGRKGEKQKFDFSRPPIIKNKSQSR